MSVKSIAKNVSISPRKVGEVASLVRGRTVADALVILEHTPRASAIPVRKAIESAKANADHNHNYKPDSLVITEISITPGMRLKRFRPQARGSAASYIKRSSHIRVIVDGEVRKPKSTKKTVDAKTSKPQKGKK